MHRDKRLGLAMGLLIVAIVGAFFFRLKPTSHDGLPEMAQQATIENIIEKMPTGPYLAGLEDDNSPIPKDPSKHRFSQNLPQWDVPEMFGNQEQMANNKQSKGSLAPNPIPSDSNSPIFSVSQKRIIRSKENNIEEQLPEMIDDDPFDLPPMDVSLKNETFPQRDEMFQDQKKINSKVPRATFKARPYRVKDGDTLQKLSQKFLGDKNRYQEIFRLNKNKLRTADDLRTGMLIRIPMIPRIAQLEKKIPESNRTPVNKNYHLTIEAEEKPEPETFSQPKQFSTKTDSNKEEHQPVGQWPFSNSNLFERQGASRR